MLLLTNKERVSLGCSRHFQLPQCNVWENCIDRLSNLRLASHVMLSLLCDHGVLLVCVSIVSLVLWGLLSLALTILFDRLGLPLYASLSVWLSNLFSIGISVYMAVQCLRMILNALLALEQYLVEKVGGFSTLVILAKVHWVVLLKLSELHCQISSDIMISVTR